MSLTRTLLTTAALGASVIVPSAAQAAEGFTGVTSGGNVVHFQTDTIPGLSPKPVNVTGLASARGALDFILQANYEDCAGIMTFGPGSTYGDEGTAAETGY